MSTFQPRGVVSVFWNFRGCGHVEACLRAANTNDLAMLGIEPKDEKAMRERSYAETSVLLLDIQVELS